MEHLPEDRYDLRWVDTGSGPGFSVLMPKEVNRAPITASRATDGQVSRFMRPPVAW
jgi:hypothetical protein